MHDMLLDRYAAWLAARGCSPRTVTSRVAAVRALARHAGHPADELTMGDVAGWLAAKRPGWTRHTYHAHARVWHAYLIAAGLRADDPAALIPRPRAPHGVPRPADTRQLAASVARSSGRARTMLLLAAYAGLRVSEIAAVHADDVTETCLYVAGKGDSRMMIPTHPLVWAEAAAQSGWWFPSPCGGHVTRQTVWRIMTTALDGQATPHQLRHWYGTQALRACGNLRVVQQLMRHASPATTAVYTLVDDEQRQSVVRALPALDSLAG